MFQQDLQPVGDSLALSALCGALPLLALFVLLGGLKLKAWVAGLISLAVALVVAILFFDMPVGQAVLAGTEGAAFGNIIAGGIIGAAIDMSNGSAYRYPANVLVKVERP